MPPRLDCRLLCASSCAYDITPGTCTYTPTAENAVQTQTVGYTATRTACGGIGLIDACLIGKNQDGVVVAFRGTLPPSLNDPQSFLDWILVDFDAIPKPGGPGLGAVPGLVHSGFYDATMTIISDVVNAVKALNPNQDLPVFVTGHSLGGAMASIGAWILSQNAGIPVSKVITFASPKPGDGAFKSAYEGKITQVRYENYEDVVPLMPPGGDFLNAFDLLPNFIPGAADVKNRVKQAQDRGYEPVGNLLFITSDRQVISNEPLFKQVWDVVTEIGDDIWHHNFDSFVNAHSHDCGQGYMTGACPGVCPTT
jgi:pimeloyl-ACP methyl ester carboxylesterase